MGGDAEPYYSMTKDYRLRSFTLIELIITIVLMGILMIPLGIMSMEYMRGIVYVRDLGTAEGLGKIETAKINNLSYSDATLADGYDNTITNYEGYPYDLRRTVNYVAGWNNNLKQVQVRVYPSGNTTAFLANLITYIANVNFGAGSAGGAAATGNSADSLVVSGGSIAGMNLENVTLQNTGSTPITITAMLISFTGQSGIKFASVTIDGTQRWSGNASSGDSIALNTSFTLAGNTTYSNTGIFTFSKTLTSVASLILIMDDGSQSTVYSW